MNRDFPERDWKYLRKIKPDMLWPLLRHDLLERDHIQNLSEETQVLVGNIRADLPRKA